MFLAFWLYFQIYDYISVALLETQHHDKKKFQKLASHLTTSFSNLLHAKTSVKIVRMILRNTSL